MSADLERFVAAQRGVYATALAELRAGQKRSHWMWFIFPQIAGLGLSDMARRYAISGLGEAKAYLAHPALGPRYREGVEALLAHEGRSAESIMGGVDAMKLRSSLTLFAEAGPEEALFGRALRSFFKGPDERTLSLLQ